MEWTSPVEAADLKRADIVNSLGNRSGRAAGQLIFVRGVRESGPGLQHVIGASGTAVFFEVETFSFLGGRCAYKPRGSN